MKKKICFGEALFLPLVKAKNQFEYFEKTPETKKGNMVKNY